MRILIISHSFSKGGAAIAAQRWYELLSPIYQVEKYSEVNKEISKYHELLSKVIRGFERICLFFLSRDNRIQRSLNVFSSTGYHPEYESYDVIFIHQVNRSFVSFRDLRNIISNGKNVVIYLHDEWFLNATNHYSLHKQTLTIIDKIIIKIKIKLLSFDNVQIISPSQWLADKVREVGLECYTIPNPIPDAYVVNRAAGRLDPVAIGKKKLNLLFFIHADKSKFVKGTDIQVKMLDTILRKDIANILAVDDQNRLIDYVDHPNLTIRQRANSIEEMRELFRLSDVLVHPSRYDNFPQICTEAICSGIPIIALNQNGCGELLLNGCGISIKEEFTDGELEAIILKLKSEYIKLVENCASLSATWTNEKILSSFRELLDAH